MDSIGPVQVRRSHKLSKCLRHNPSVPRDDEGWSSVEDAAKATGMTVQEVIGTAESNSRYELSDDRKNVRALHGHSVHVTYGDPIDPPERLLHGTSASAWDLIQESGAILPMKRCMVHLTTSIEKAMDVAGRRDDGEGQAILSVDAKAMQADGYEFYLSGDGIYLVCEVPVKYVCDRRVLSDPDHPRSPGLSEHPLRACRISLCSPGPCLFRAQAEFGIIKSTCGEAQDSRISMILSAT